MLYVRNAIVYSAGDKLKVKINMWGKMEAAPEEDIVEVDEENDLSQKEFPRGSSSKREEGKGKKRGGAKGERSGKGKGKGKGKESKGKGKGKGKKGKGRGKGGKGKRRTEGTPEDDE